MNRLILAFAITFLAQLLPAQDITYVLFSRDGMNQLDYRYTYPNLKGENPVFAFSMQPNPTENYVFTAGSAGTPMTSLPKGTVNCHNLELSDDYVAAINRGTEQMVVILQTQKGYWLTPIGSASHIARKGSEFWVRSKNCTFIFDTLRLENDVNLAVSGSPTAVYFKGAQFRHCLMEYDFHCQPNKSGQLRTDIELIPSIGFTADRSGLSGTKALENEMQLSAVNGKAIDDFIQAGCPPAINAVTPKSQKAAPSAYNKGISEADKELESIPAQYNYQGDQISILCPEMLGAGYHIVQKGENLLAISRTYKVDVQSLIKWNNIKDPDKIEVCQAIWYQKPSEQANLALKGTSPKQVKGSTLNRVIDQRKLRETSSDVAFSPDGRHIVVAHQRVKLWEPDLYNQPQTYSTPNEYYDGSDNSDLNPKSANKPRAAMYVEEWPLEEGSANIGADKGAKTTKSLSPKSNITQPNSIQFREYVTRQGDNIRSIAIKYKVNATELALANGVALNESLMAGERILVPNTGEDPPPAKPRRTIWKKSDAVNADVNPMAVPSLDFASTNGPKAAQYTTPEEEAQQNAQHGQDSPVAKPEFSAKQGITGKPVVLKLAEGKEYKVHRRGDTLRSIAARQNVNIDELAKLNKDLGLDQSLTPGMRILIPIK